MCFLKQDGYENHSNISSPNINMIHFNQRHSKDGWDETADNLFNKASLFDDVSRFEMEVFAEQQPYWRLPVRSWGDSSLKPIQFILK